MNPDYARALAEAQLRKHGLAQLGWTFDFDRSSHRRLGACWHDKRQISLNKRYTMLNDRDQVLDTILHEIAHALAGPTAGHGPLWQQICRELGCVPSARVTRENAPNVVAPTRHVTVSADILGL
jgi:predicted SprT family Zn-dependent metalloprotease